MISVPVTLTGSPATVASLVISSLPSDVAPLVGNRDDFRMNAIIQAHEDNDENLSIGGSADRSGFIVPGGSAALDRLNLNKTYIDGKIGDVAIILLMD